MMITNDKNTPEQLALVLLAIHRAGADFWQSRTGKSCRRCRDGGDADVYVP